jgi:hypothetical protein
MFFRNNDERPKRARELLASIAGEMKASADDSRRGALSQRTIKELLIDLVGLVRGAKSEKERAGWLADLAEKSTLAFFCFLCIGAILASASAHSDVEFFEENRVFIRTLGIGMSAIYIGIAMEKMGVVALLWRYNIAKFIVSLAVSALVVFSAGKASSVINGVFGIDAGAFPYARALLAGWIAFSMATKPLLWLVGLLAFCQAAIIAIWFWTKFVSNDEKREAGDFPWASVGFVFLSMILIGDVSRWIYRSLSDEQAPAKVYQLARMLDFNGRHQCTNLKASISVVYIGPEQRRVLIDDRPEPAPTFGAFVTEPVSVWEAPPEAFKVEDCQMVRAAPVPAINPATPETPVVPVAQ